MSAAYHASVISLKQVPYTGISGNANTALFLISLLAASGLGAGFVLSAPARRKQTRFNFSIPTAKNFTLLKTKRTEKRKSEHNFRPEIQGVFASW